MPILDQFGRPVESRKKPERRPLAAAPLHHSSREYVADGMTPASLAAMLRQADAGDMRQQAELFDAIIEKDGHLLGEYTKRTNAILDVPFKIIPASDDARDLRVAEFVQAFFDEMTDFEDNLAAMQTATGHGYSALEVHWDYSEGQAVPSNFSWLDHDRLVFQDQRGNVSRTPRLITDDDLMGAAIPAWKVLFHAYGGKSGHPTRSGILRVCAWMYLFKNYGIKDWVIFCEVYGMPLRLGKYEPGASEDDKDALATAIRAIGTDAAGVISKSTDIEFVDKQGTRPAAEMYKELTDFCNKEESKALLGQTLTADVGDVGSYAASRTHNDVRKDLARADTRAAAGSLRHQIIRPLVGFNFGWDTAVPRYAPLWEEQEDLEKKAKWVGAFTRMAEVPKKWLYSEFGVPQPEKGDDTIGGPAPGGSPTPAKKTRISAKQAALRAKNDEGDIPAGSPASAVDVLVTMFEREIDDLPGDIIAAVRDVADQADDLEDVYTALADLAAENAIENAAGKLQKAMAAAELAGRMGVMDEIEGADDD